MTLQPLAVLFTGAVLGSRRGALALLLYLAEGAVGLPVSEGTGHSDYLDAGRPTLAAVGGVVAGTGGPR